MSHVLVFVATTLITMWLSLTWQELRGIKKALESIEENQRMVR